MSESSNQQSASDDADWLEPMVAFGGVVAVLAGLSGLAGLWAPLGDHILAVAAVVFIGVPFVILARRGADFERYGIDLERIPLRHVGLGLAVSLGIVPLYAAGHHLWETAVEERQFEPSLDNYRQWSVDLDAPSIADAGRESLQVRTFSDHLHIEWAHAATPEPAVAIEADRPFQWHHSSGLSIRHHPDRDSNGGIDSPIMGVDHEPAQRWLATPSAQGVDGHLVISSRPSDGPTPGQLRLELDRPDSDAGPDIFVGTSHHDADEPIELERNYWWLIIWGLSHLVLVALPEEYFYRGYLQTRLHDLLEAGDDGEHGEETVETTTFLGLSRANWATSGLFAIGHILIPIGGSISLARGAVFFPSLLFGWLRDRTGSIIAPTVFHAAANMMVLVVAVHYF